MPTSITHAGLTVNAALADNSNQTRIEINAAEMAKLKLTPAKFHRDWNYTIAPRK